MVAATTALYSANKTLPLRQNSVAPAVHRVGHLRLLSAYLSVVAIALAPLQLGAANTKIACSASSIANLRC